MKTLFISDLHLNPKRPDIQACFDQFISACLQPKKNQTIDSLYILGDLFEFWIGDDASLPVYAQTIQQLRQLVDSGIPIYVMHGNRDFLLGAEFEQVSGCQLIPDLYHLPIANTDKNDSVLLSHGDIFCTDDKDYMQFRQMVRNPDWQRDFLAQTVAERLAIAQSMREQSKQQGKQKSSEITDVNQQTVEKIMLEQQCMTLIHGHTHRPAIHEFTLSNQQAVERILKRILKRIVLPDWTPDAKIFEL
ncbi:UDP-2,3-diacylglucosamine diphosphatase [sulfur-oxidizing endosymbiont of Gigantopelta aegis]|uniref:UDP-2,3-diacylglucosamine diphosphatase n=1 Tax=sulfur-oxidizing endosymbiont of Gigantopelta aegis TaxID=2794934 RepID=UPI0018DC2066|nr:UDP-2,3-diacylglucosamine diphosphatase [sulfur-oxidizing endosymbiont of Gigantopelta aegis]